MKYNFSKQNTDISSSGVVMFSILKAAEVQKTRGAQAAERIQQPSEEELQVILFYFLFDFFPSKESAVLQLNRLLP